MKTKRNGLIAIASLLQATKPTPNHVAFVTGNNPNEQHFIPRNAGVLVSYKQNAPFKRPTLN
jgi:hypothetical protein